MRTTVTLDPDVAAFVQTTMRERGVTFKQALNDAIRAGARREDSSDLVDFPTYDLGESALDLTKALRIAGELEDSELGARLARGA